MNITPYYEEAIRSYSAEDKEFFDKATSFLPKRKETTPYHSGPHSVRSLRMAYELARKPANVLEIGFCLGHSASLWFALGAKTVTSIENSDRDQTRESCAIMEGVFGYEKFQFLHPGQNTEFSVQKNTGLIFIDGDHSIEAVEKDTQFALQLKIPFILFDDYFPHWGPGTQPAIEKYKLVPLAIIGTMALCTTKFS